MTKLTSLIHIVAIAALALAAPCSFASDSNSNHDRWQFGAELYLWTTAIDAETASGDDLEIDFDDILDNFDFGFLGTFAARKNNWTLLTDIIYLDISGRDKTTANLINQPVTAKLDIGMESWVVNGIVAYTIARGDNYEFNILGGGRYLYLESDLDFTITGPVNTIRLGASDSGNVFDGVVGVNGRYSFNDKWYMTYYLDGGAGDSDSTWQAVLSGGYKFNSFDMSFGYRYLDWEFDDEALMDNLNISGPYAGIKLYF